MDHKFSGGMGNELLDPVWEQLGQMDSITFDAEVIQKLNPIISAWQSCKIEHPKHTDQWLRPPFGKGVPWAGGFQVGMMGGVTEREHKIVR